MFKLSLFKKIVGTGIYFIITLTFLSINNVSADGNQINSALTNNSVMGGKGILPIPVVYDGRVQNLLASWSNH